MLQSTLIKVKDPLPTKQLTNVVYKVPCDCGLVYIGETKRRLETQLKEHKDTTRLGYTNNSMLDKAYREDELLITETLHIQIGPKEIMNRDEAIELPSCLIKAVRGTIAPAIVIGGIEVPAGGKS